MYNIVSFFINALIVIVATLSILLRVFIYCLAKNNITYLDKYKMKKGINIYNTIFIMLLLTFIYSIGIALAGTEILIQFNGLGMDSLAKRVVILLLSMLIFISLILKAISDFKDANDERRGIINVINKNLKAKFGDIKREKRERTSRINIGSMVQHI